MIIQERLPQGFTMRPPTMNDVEAVTNLMRTNEITIDGQAEITQDNLRSYWQMPNFDLATDAWLVLSPEGQIVGTADLDHQQHAHLYSGGEVHPEYQGRGIGSYLLSLIEARALEHIPLAEPGVRVVLNARASVRNTAAQRLLEEHEYKQVRTFWRMGIELNEAPPAAQWAEGITVHTMPEGMERAVYEANEEAFQDHWGHMPHTFEEWQHWTVKHPGFDPTLWFLAMDGDQIAGLAICQKEETGGWVHDLAIRRPWRRRGLGLALLHHAFAEFYRRDIHNIYLGVDAQSLTGATRLYERAGMHVVRQFNRYEKELRAGKELSTQSVDV